MLGTTFVLPRLIHGRGVALEKNVGINREREESFDSLSESIRVSYALYGRL